MPQEERYITFSLEEIYKAVVMLCEQRGDLAPPPSGVPQSIEFDAHSPENSICLVVRPEGVQGDVRLKFDRAFFVGALVLLCKSGGIPLPMGGTKILKVVDNAIVMKMTLSS